MSSTYAGPLDQLDGVLDELAAISPEFRSAGERQEFLLRVTKVKARGNDRWEQVCGADASTGAGPTER